MSERAPLSGPLGILMLETRFPRIVGDVGNAASYDFPVIFRTMQGIGSADAVTAHPDRPRVLAALKANAEALAAEGAIGLSTSCGFLALYQDDLAAVSPVPVATSALLHIKALKGRKVSAMSKPDGLSSHPQLSSNPAAVRLRTRLPTRKAITTSTARPMAACTNQGIRRRLRHQGVTVPA